MMKTNESMGGRYGGDGSEAPGRPVVLVVDDVEANLVAFEAMLRRDDVEIVTSASARAALELLLDRDVALAVVDVQMPEIDGFALAELMRGVEKTRCVPIIFVTASSPDMSWEFKGYESGAVDFLFKPVDERILRSKVDVFVRLERQRQQLIQAERVREMFVGILGHDLRNPMNGVSLSAQAALRIAKEEGVRTMLEGIVRSSARMTRMISQLLDVTRLRLGGGVSLSPVPADLRAITEEVVNELADQKKRINLETAGDTRGTWDADRLAQIISNLAGNAIQHSAPETPVTIRVNGTEPEALLLEVHNSGPSIPEDLRDEIFQPFRRRKHSRGLGLGLFVCSQFAIAHGGAIEFESSETSGTCFRVRLPRHANPALNPG